MPFGCNENQSISLAIVKIQILSYFLANPHTRDTLKGFSGRFLINHQLMLMAMEKLIEVGIIEKSGPEEESIYRLKISYATMQ